MSGGMGLEWYKREPAAYLKDVQGLSAKEHAVYSVVLDLIYVHGGTLNNDPGWIGGWIKDMGAAAVRNAISTLVDRGILIIEKDKITQKRAQSEVKTKRNHRKNASVSGRIGGERSAELRRANKENNDLGEADPKSEIQPEKRREEKSIEKGTTVPKKKNQTELDIGASPAATSGKSQSNFDEEFEAVWKAYPRKVGKGNAKKAWTKARKIASKDEIAPGLWNHIKVWNGGTAKDKIPHLSTWLNGERWHDDANAAANRSANSDEQLDSLTAPQEDPLGQEFLDSFKPSNQQIEGVLSGAIKKIGKA